MADKNMSPKFRRELQEAIAAGEYARQQLEEAADSLRSASGWGMLDIFGGGFISTFAKHSRLSDARQEIGEAKRALIRFASEAQDVDGSGGLRIDVGRFLTFTDFFFDDPISDVLVQSKIEKAREQVDQAIDEVDRMLETLREL